MLTAAVRDLHKRYPRRFVTDVRTSCPALWENSPYITPLSEEDPRVKVLDCSYPLINTSNSRPYHCLHGFISYLNDRLGLDIQPTAFRGDIHLSAQEKAWFSQVHELAGIDLPFWIVAAGGKYDITIKWWSTERYQRVIDHFRGRIQFVQIGAPGHYHPKLHGTIDLRGKTSLREMVRLIYHSHGVLCGVTAAMHLSAAIEPKPGASRNRPCVVVAGGREPAHWEAYPDHQYISTNGTLPCCTRGGCWRSRTVPLGDADDRDLPRNLCVDVRNDLPHCMDLITADDVINRIELYLKGGAVKALTRPQLRAAEKAVILSQQSSYDERTLTVHNARLELERFIRDIPKPPFSFQGRGIVICGGGVRYFTNAWVCISILRQLGCTLPIELWHLGSGEMDDEMRRLVAPLNVACVDAVEVARKYPVRKLGGWQSKPYAILHSRFQEVLFLDADNVPVRNPEYLFDSRQYRKTGAIFWPDYVSRSEKPDVAWESCGIERPGRTEFESGQIIVDKTRVWNALRLALWFNEHSDFYYQHVHGDKETFHLAFHKLKQPYGFVQTPIHPLAGTMCQHDFQGRRVFQHRNMDKWNLFLRNRRVADFWLEDDCLRHVQELRERWDGMAGKYLSKPEFKPRRTLPGDVQICGVMISCEKRAGYLKRTLQSLKKSDWGNTPLQIRMDPGGASSRQESLTANAFAALTSALRVAATHILFLEDDLEFNRHILHNLRRWQPVSRGIAALASLYNPGARMLAANFRENYSLCPNDNCYGSQAFLISREALKYVLDHWNEVEGMQDIKISRLMGRIQSPMFYHTPSLVQHIGKRSSWGGGFHQAKDYDPDWKAS